MLGLLHFAGEDMGLLSGAPAFSLSNPLECPQEHLSVVIHVELGEEVLILLSWVREGDHVYGRCVF